MAGAKRAAKAKPVKLRIRMMAEIEGQQGIDDFARMLRVLHDNGFKGQVRRMVSMFVKAAEKRGVAVPPELKEWEKTDA